MGLSAYAYVCVHHVHVCEGGTSTRAHWHAVHSVHV